MNAEDKIIRAKVQLQNINPFFAYLTLHLKQKRADEVVTMGVDIDGNLYYNEEFVNQQTESDMIINLCHEVLHLALNHLTRRGNRDQKLWNLSADLIVNEILSKNFEDFRDSFLYKKGVNANNLEDVFGIVIEKVEEKFVEEVYDILNKNIKNKTSGFDKFVNDYKFDKHYDLDSLSEEKKKELERKYGKSFDEIKRKLESEMKKRLVEANAFAKLRGNSPAGMERIFDKLLEFKLNWKEILRKTISDNLPYDFSYRYPSRKSIATGVYMPSTVKDKKLDVVCVVDLSGSISDDEMREFMTEVYSISKSFRNVDMKVVTHDTEPQDQIEVKNGCIDKLLNIKLHGLGGTSHTWLPKYLEKYPNTKIIVCFTDGYTDFPDEEKLFGREVLWILTKNSVDEKEIPFGKVIKL